MTATPETFDLIVIGAGSGTQVSAAAASAGWRVAVIDPGPFGGTCLNRGCIPSKMLVHVADVARTIRRADRFGIEARIERDRLAIDRRAGVRRHRPRRAGDRGGQPRGAEHHRGQGQGPVHRAAPAGHRRPHDRRRSGSSSPPVADRPCHRSPVSTRSPSTPRTMSCACPSYRDAWRSSGVDS